jgi:predicted secreted acid phosphatase
MRKMRFFSNLTIICLAFSFCGGFAKKSTPELTRDQLRDYYESGKYLKEVEVKLSEAKVYLESQLQTRKNRLAIVLDVDETSLSNYRDLERLAFTHDPQALTGAYMMGNAQVIAPVLELYQYAIANKVAVFFVSERPNTPEISIATTKNLKMGGFDQWEELILKPLDKKDLTVAEFKTQARKHIAARGFDIVLNIGDQHSDFAGGYAEVKVQVPNPFYGV